MMLGTHKHNERKLLATNQISFLIVIVFEFCPLEYEHEVLRMPHHVASQCFTITGNTIPFVLEILSDLRPRA